MTKAEQEWSLIEALEYCKGKRLLNKCCAGCPYAGVGCAIDVAISKLKAQEPVKPILSRGWYWCGGTRCRNSLTSALEDDTPAYKPNYCERCGRKVKWE